MKEKAEKERHRERKA